MFKWNDIPIDTALPLLAINLVEMKSSLNPFLFSCVHYGCNYSINEPYWIRNVWYIHTHDGMLCSLFFFKFWYTAQWIKATTLKSEDWVQSWDSHGGSRDLFPQFVFWPIHPSFDTCVPPYTHKEKNVI